ncbi:hypothetical protein BLS_008120 [Venturia inaequalis]|uniref:Uncharacterized protein n=1 Tax=Venturia inaequalis TaxID=5025 RepID=A0A8H3YPA0_VENIN|nr:hypothetical protein BLS_008120 [Venturia inaequalis]
MSAPSAERRAPVLDRALVVLGLIFCSCAIVPGILYSLKREDHDKCSAWDKNGITAAEIDNRLNNQLAMHDALPWTDETLFRIKGRQCDDVFQETFFLITLIVLLLDLGGLILIYALRDSIWSLVRKPFTCGSRARESRARESRVRGSRVRGNRARGSVGQAPFDAKAAFVDPSNGRPRQRHRGDGPGSTTFWNSLTFPGLSKRLSAIPEVRSRPGSREDNSKDSGPSTAQGNTGKTHQERLFEQILKGQKDMEKEGMWNFAQQKSQPYDDKPKADFEKATVAHKTDREKMKSQFAEGDEKDSISEDIQPPPKAKLQSPDDSPKPNFRRAPAASIPEDEDVIFEFASSAEKGKGRGSDSISEDMKPTLMAMLRPNQSDTKNQLKSSSATDTAMSKPERASVRMKFPPFAEDDPRRVKRPDNGKDAGMFEGFSFA